MIKNLRLLREEKGISQQKLAEMLNTSQQNIFKYEKTACEPDIATLIKIAEIFNVTVDYLIGNSEIRYKDTKLNAVMLTEKEKLHINLWRKLPQNIQEKMDKLIESIEK